MNGAEAATGGGDSLLAQARAITAREPWAVACGATAAYVHGVSTSVGGTPALELGVLTPSARTHVPGWVVREEPIPAEDVTTCRGVRVTTPERTALDCAVRLDRVEAVIALDQFLRGHGVRRRDLKARVAALPSARHARRAREALRLADPGAASPRETWLRLCLIGAGLPRPSTQMRVPLGAGRICYLDLAWEEYQLATEYDGREHHSSASDRERDDERRAVLREQGWRIIPVAHDVIPYRVAAYLRHMADALLARGWRPPPDHLVTVQAHIRAARRPGYRPLWPF
ncbi:hypothetical protein HNP84_002378 [Thermocatellispora tengchongensis]|uniref:AbiEi antitoxin C-terminal domain-containing protein n=1 Tax=Thermocatellispora tengchongensis TaxID=1073253 RepID=A0A840NZU1_9ACTN|nr:type IV toxin-antitoxin system AbiEi family antitoxin [Thermocatellispora tengchongensis]MBB5132662.1 hypothetical protein [Thermocatellispora tengchongensis]